MRLASLFSTGATFKSASRICLAAILVLVFSTATVLSGCTDEAEPASEQTIQALTILGDGATVVGGIHALDGMQSFAAAIDRETSLESQDQLSEMLEELGIDIESESVDVYFGIRNTSSSEVAGAVIYAPISDENLERFAEKESFLERYDEYEDAHGHTIAFQNAPSDYDDMGIFTSLIEDGMLLVASSRDQLDTMHARAHGVDAETGEKSMAVLSDLINTASRNQFWVASESIQDVIQNMPTSGSVREVELLSKAVVGVAVTFNLDAGKRDSPQVSGKILLSARDGINASDVSSMVEGLIALGKINLEGNQIAEDILDNIDVSETGGVTQIAFRVSASDIRSLEYNLSDLFSTK